MNKKNRGSKGFPILEIKCSKHRVFSEISLIDSKVLILFKAKLGFSDFFSLDIEDIVVLNNVELFVLVPLVSVADPYHHKFIFFNLPHCIDGYLKILHAIRYSHLLVYLVNAKFTLRIVSKIIGFEIPLLILSCFKPAHH
jgi:hypothetical protein